MALKDLKSDLSKFRMPRKDPLVNKKRTAANKKQNQTPLSSMLKTTPDVKSSDKTPMKQGTNPSKFDNSSKFLGETNPDKVDNSSKFLGETDPSAFDNSSNFLGEVCPTAFDNSSNFLGETNPTSMDNSSNFLGETNPTTFDNSSNFLGETNQTSMDNSSNFLGETDPNIFDNSPNFLGETSPNIFDNSSNFLGETNAYGFDMSSKFLGETCPTNFTFNPNHINAAVTPSEVNYFPDIHARGFTSHFSSISDGTKFIGVNPDNTIFDTTTSTYGNFGNSFPGISFAPGYGTFKPVGTYTGDTPRYNPDTKYFLDNQLTNKGISQLQQMQQSPSFLDKMYDKFNLKDDSYNTGFPTTALKHPLILRGIQKKGGEPEHYGQFGLSFDDGFVRGGSISAATRSAIDVARIGSWLITPKGILWGAKQSLLQFSNKFQNIWTPLNLLTAVGAQHLGIKPMRPGIIPFYDPLWSYAPNKLIQKDKLDTIYKVDLPLMSYFKGVPFPTQTYFGGPMSVYGIGFTTTTRYENTFNSFKKDIFHILAKYQQKINPFKKFDEGKKYAGKPGNATESKIGVSVPSSDTEKKKFGVVEPNRTTSDGIYAIGQDNPDIRDDIQDQNINPFKTEDEGLKYHYLPDTIKEGVSVPNHDEDKKEFGVVEPKRTNDDGIYAIGQDNPDIRDDIAKQGDEGINPFKTDDEGKKYKGEAGNADESKDDVSVPTSDADLKEFGVVEPKRTKDDGIYAIGNDNPDIKTDIQGQGINPFKTDDKDKVYSPGTTGYRGSSGVKKDVSVPTDTDEKKKFGLGKEKTTRTTKDGTYKVDEDNPDIKKDIQNQKLNPFKTGEEGRVYSPSDSGFVSIAKDDVSVPTDTTELLNFGLAKTKDDIKNIVADNGAGILKDNHGNDLAKSNKTTGTLIDDYETITYGKIPDIRLTDGTVTHDFRSLLSADNVNKKIADKTDYKKTNIHKRVHFGHPGKVGDDREKWWLTAKNGERYDKINARAITSNKPLNDLIHLWFKKGGEYIQFRGVVSSISETFSPSWSAVNYGGRADSGWKYSSFGRTLGFSFQVTATSRIEMASIWEKLQYLATLTMPTYLDDGKGYRGNLFRFRLGSLYNNKLAFFNTFSYGMSTTMPWEISPKGSDNPIGELPRSVDVTVGLQILDGGRQQLGAKIYGQHNSTGASTPTGKGDTFTAHVGANVATTPGGSGATPGGSGASGPVGGAVGGVVGGSGASGP